MKTQLIQKIKQFSILLLMISFIGNCTDDEQFLPDIISGYTYTTDSETGTVTFINISENARSFSWDFGDGNTSTEINPTHTYAVTGDYEVSLTASNSSGASLVFQSTISVTVPEIINFPVTFGNIRATTFGGATFAIVDNPDPGGSNPTVSPVGSITNSGAAFEGFYLDFGTPIDLSTQKTITLNFWSNAPISVLVKLEGGSAPFVEVTADHGGTGWEELIFTFNSSDSFPRFTFFVDGPGTTAGTFYIDDIVQIDTPIPTEPTTAAPTPPARDAADVISIFSDAYTNITGINYDPDWGQSTDATEVMIAGNNTLKYDVFNYQGTDFSGNAQDVTGMEFLHVDMWTPDATDVKVTPINGAGSPTEVLVGMTPITTGQWVSYDIALTDFTSGGMSLDQIVQMKFDGQAGTIPSVIFLDNIYFYKAASAATEPTTAAPTPPARDAADVISIFSDAYTNITGINYDPDWGQSTDATEVMIAGNNTLKYDVFNYQGTDFSGNAQDVTGMEFLHVDMWTPDATDVKVTPINGAGSPTEVLVGMTPITTGQWVSYDIALTDFTSGGMSLDQVVQMKFDGQAGTTPSVIFLDNIYFYKDGSGGGGCPAPPSGELLPNGGFEANNGDGACWQLNAGGTNVPTIINNDANTGTYSVKMATSTVPNHVPNIKMERFAQSITGGKTIEVTFKYKITNAFVDGSILQVLMFSERSGMQGAVPHDLGNATGTGTTGTWQTYTGTFTTDAAIDEGLSLLIQATCGGAATCAGEVIIDDIVVKEQ